MQSSTRNGTMPEKDMDHPSDYHDYVIKDGKLIGKFEEMYCYATEVPWHQDELATKWFTAVGYELVKAKAPYQRAIDVGCGLGYHTVKLLPFVDHIDAFDISPTAIKRATEKNGSPRINYGVLDIRKRDLMIDRRYDLAVASTIFWAVFPEMENVIANFSSFVKPKGYLYIHQTFPSLDSDFVGRDVIPNVTALIDHFSETFMPIATISIENNELDDSGGIYHLLLQRRV